MGKIEEAVKWAYQIAIDDTHGYSQVNRNDPDYDCSSLVATALNKGGFNVSPSSWTGNLYSQLIACGFNLVSDSPKRGDIYMSHNSRLQHVVICYNENEVIQATSAENGGNDGETGDQTGSEICVSKFYVPTGGWDYHFRYPENESVASKFITECGYERVDVQVPYLCFGYSGSAVYVLQTILLGEGYSLGDCGVDGDFGYLTEKAVKEFQTDAELDADGIVGENTWQSLLTMWKR